MNLLDDARAGIIGLVGSIFSSAVGWIRIETIIDTVVVAVVSLVVTFYGNKLLRYMHSRFYKKDKE